MIVMLRSMMDQLTALRNYTGKEALGAYTREHVQHCWEASIFTFILFSIFIAAIYDEPFCLSLYLIETSFYTFEYRADPDQAALVRAAWSGSTLFAYGRMIRYDPTLVDLKSNFFVPCTNAKIYIIIHSGWSYEGKGCGHLQQLHSP